MNSLKMIIEIFVKKRIDSTMQCTEVRLANFLCGGFTTMAVKNPPERKLAKRISVQWDEIFFERAFKYSCTSVFARFCSKHHHKIARENS